MTSNERAAKLAGAVNKYALLVMAEPDRTKRSVLLLSIHEANFRDARRSSNSAVAAEWADKMDGFIRAMIGIIQDREDARRLAA